MRPAAIVLALGLLASCRPKAETPEAAMARQAADQKAAEDAIRPLVERFATQFNSGHADSLAAFYAPDAHLMLPNAPAVVGPTAIKAALEQWLAAKPTIKFVTEAVTASGDLAVERGSYEETTTPVGSRTPVTDKGKYLLHWQRIAGKWLIVDDIGNSDLPLVSVQKP